MMSTSRRPDIGPASPVVGGVYDNASVTEKISSIVLTRFTPRTWIVCFAIAAMGSGVLLVAVVYLLGNGVGIWGINIPVAWGFAITNFVWWIGIGHAGTLISAILLLLRQEWRTSINRFAEAMTLFAVICAGMFPLLHLGRPWVFYFLLPYPNTMSLWPQFRSPLVWDVFAVSTYLTVSLLFWYIGMIPDLATLRDRASNRYLQWIYGALSWGWRGSAIHWKRYQTAYFILAGLATPLVVSVHSIVSLDFAVSFLPGWHTTIFPPYFVAGAIYSGFAMVLTLAIPLRAIYHLQDFVTMRHLENCAKVMLVSGMIVAYGYASEFFMSWYPGDRFEMFMTINRMAGPYALTFWVMMACNVFIPQLLWVRRIRTSIGWLFFMSLVINIGMWVERFVIIVTSLHRDFMPSSWGMFYPTVWDWATLLGSISFFFFCFLLFVRTLPMISMSEMRELAREVTREMNRYGILARFDSEEKLLDAARQAYQAGYRRMDAFSPHPVKELAEAIGKPTTRLPWGIFAGGLMGGLGAYFMLWYATVVSLPTNVGGRPLHSAPAYIPITFELTILFASLVAVFGMLFANGLPLLNHPLFATPGFERATQDRYFLCIESADLMFDADRTREFLERLEPEDVQEVAHVE